MGYDEEDDPRSHEQHDLRYAGGLHREPERTAHQGQEVIPPQKQNNAPADAANAVPAGAFL